MRISDWSSDVCSTDLMIIGFIAPAIYLLSETIEHFHTVGAVSDQLLSSGYNTVRIALIATLATLSCGLIVAWAARTIRHGAPSALPKLCARVATSGYAVPGTVLAIGLLMPIVLIDGLASWQIGRAS